MKGPAEHAGGNVGKVPAKVGYCSPPEARRFKPGQSGNPSGRPKGSKNLKTLFQKILNEEVSLRDGEGVKKVSKAEAVLRSVVVGALKGDTRSLGMLLRLAEATGEFQDKDQAALQPAIVMFRTVYQDGTDAS
jgi:hypothetical protein